MRVPAQRASSSRLSRTAGLTLDRRRLIRDALLTLTRQPGVPLLFPFSPLIHSSIQAARASTNVGDDRYSRPMTDLLTASLLAINPWDEVIPNWILATAAFATLVVAIVAALYAKGASDAAKKQAISAAAQLEHAKEAAREQALAAAAQLEHAKDVAVVQASSAAEQLRVAEAQAVLAAQDSALLRRRSDESRLDARMPSILARATLPREHLLYHGIDTPSVWTAIEERLELPGTAADTRYVFRTVVDLVFENISDQPALIDFIDLAQGELDGLRQGTQLVVPPHSASSQKWVRNVGSYALVNPDDLGRVENALFRIEFWVRDLGMNVRDTYRLNASLAYFERDGSRLIVQPHPTYALIEESAVPLPERAYDRLTQLDQETSSEPTAD